MTFFDCDGIFNNYLIANLHANYIGERRSYDDKSAAVARGSRPYLIAPEDQQM